VGFRAFYQWQIGKVLVEPSLKAAWEHEYKYSALPITAGFAGIPGPSATAAPAFTRGANATNREQYPKSLVPNRTCRSKTTMGSIRETGRDHRWAFLTNFQRFLKSTMKLTTESSQDPLEVIYNAISPNPRLEGGRDYLQHLVRGRYSGAVLVVREYHRLPRESREFCF
jgi:hypothetical protein